MDNVKFYSCIFHTVPTMFYDYRSAAFPKLLISIKRRQTIQNQQTESKIENKTIQKLKRKSIGLDD